MILFHHHQWQNRALVHSSAKPLSFFVFHHMKKPQAKPRLVEWISVCSWEKVSTPIQLGSLCLHSCQFVYDSGLNQLINISCLSSSWQGAGMAQAPQRGRAKPKLASGCCWWDCTCTEMKKNWYHNQNPTIVNRSSNNHIECKSLNQIYWREKFIIIKQLGSFMVIIQTFPRFFLS
jgi:hypothetical protein